MLLRNMRSKVTQGLTRTFSDTGSLHPAIPRCVTRPKYKLSEQEKSNNKKVIDPATIEHLERISLVDFASVEGIQRLEEAIKLAEIVTQVDTIGVQPLYTILEDESLRLREDIAEPPDNRDQLMKLSVCSEEDYFVAPQGNVPLSYQNKYSDP